MREPVSARFAARAIIIMALPLPLAILMATTSGRFAVATCLVLPLAVLAGGPSLWPGWRRVSGLLLVGPAVATTLVGGGAFLFVAIGSLCTSDETHDLISTPGACVAAAGFLLPYALGSAWAVGRAQRVVWAWPLVILCTLVIGSGTLLLLEGGVHHCET
jgi:hypothetical protein